MGHEISKSESPEVTQYRLVCFLSTAKVHERHLIVVLETLVRKTETYLKMIKLKSEGIIFRVRQKSAKMLKV